MKICGLQKTTLLDFPGRVAATIFTGGCNFRCPFCHNSGLLGSDAEEYECQEDILAFLEKRKRVLGRCLYHRRRAHPAAGPGGVHTEGAEPGTGSEAGYQWLHAWNIERFVRQRAFGLCCNGH